jgi:hypothetical protein
MPTSEQIGIPCFTVSTIWIVGAKESEASLCKNHYGDHISLFLRSPVLICSLVVSRYSWNVASAYPLEESGESSKSVGQGRRRTARVLRYIFNRCRVFDLRVLSWSSTERLEQDLMEACLNVEEI